MNTEKTVEQLFNENQQQRALLAQQAATIAGLTDHRNDLMNERRTIAEKSVAPYIDQLNALTSMAEVLRSDRDRLAGGVERLTKKQPINTHVRLFDLVRYMRAELHAADLINGEEYAWLSGGSGMAHDPKGGSPSPRRLEDYDDLKARLATAEKDAQGRLTLPRQLFEQLQRHLRENAFAWANIQQFYKGDVNPVNSGFHQSLRVESNRLFDETDKVRLAFNAALDSLAARPSAATEGKE